MTRIARLWLYAASCLLVCLGAFQANAATPANLRVLVLPFEVNAEPDLAYLEDSLPDLVIERLVAQGFSVVPREEVQKLLAEQGLKTLDLASVRDLSLLARANYALYGSFTQLGESISLDARLVEALGVQPAKPLFIQKEGLINILPAVDEMAQRVAANLLKQDSIAEVEVRGTKVLDADVVLMRLSSRKGDKLDPKMINREIKRIYDLGYFSDVKATAEQTSDGLKLIYTVQEKPRIEAITVEGSDAVDTDEIFSVMSTKTGSVMNEKLMSQDIIKVTDLYRQKGYYLAEVSHRVVEGTKGAASLVLSVNEGQKLYIKEVRIVGAEQIDESDILDELALRPRNMISWITGTGVLREEYLERDGAAIGAYYLNRGFMDVRVSDADVVYEEDGIIVAFAVKEGTRYKVGKVEFRGDLIDTDEKLFSLTKMDEFANGEGFFNYEELQNDTKKLTQYYNDYGYAFADSNFRTERRDGDIVDITYVINKKQKVYVRRVEVEGNKHTRDNVIRREMRLTDGDLYSGSKLRRSNQRLNNLGYFAQADIEMIPTSNPEEVDLKVKVKEKNTGQIAAGVAYSTYSSFGIGGSISEANLFGKGYRAALTATFSGRDNEFDFTFINPHYNDTKLQVGVNAYLRDSDMDDYDKSTIGGVLSFAYPLGEYTRASWYYRLDQYKYSNVDDDAAKTIRDYEGTNLASVTGFAISRDTIDNRMRPTGGTYVKGAIDYGGGMLQGTDHFIRLFGDARYFQKLTNDHVIHLRVRGATLFENDSSEEIPVHERIYLGGINSIRGYDRRDISPKDPESDDSIGGTRAAYANLEYIWYFDDEMGIYFIPFFDSGFVIDPEQGQEWADEIKSSVGLEVRWQSPLGNLRFAYGYPLNKVDGKRKSGKFEFTMGQTF
ncbi:outer membrane protein assembly factor BamA [Oleidesulfovibrio sp.]|uniref:outer membrane protein assembly factor BamA n=1 Tax=Oleidesulfovibrio sp. TaxID=2909707 RepID=UPI003A8A27BF